MRMRSKWRVCFQEYGAGLPRTTSLRFVNKMESDDSVDVDVEDSYMDDDCEIRKKYDRFYDNYVACNILTQFCQV